MENNKFEGGHITVFIYLLEHFFSFFEIKNQWKFVFLNSASLNSA